jgi:maltose/moltooligosaccharide transporter
MDIKKSINKISAIIDLKGVVDLMQFDYKKVFYVGLIFFIIALFWQTYDMLIARTLIDKYGLNQTWSGIVMAIDNVLAVFLLPVFGAISDKSNHRLGKRTPFIIIGTVIAAFAFMGLSFTDELQTQKIQSTTIVDAHYDVAFHSDDVSLYDSNHWRYVIDMMAEERSLAYELGLITEEQYIEWEQNIYLRMQSLLDGHGDVLNTRTLSNVRDIYYNYLSQRAWEVTAQNPTNLIIFLSIIFVALIGMSIFRSPAIALMPDVTMRPLRSKGNAMMTLMGTAGGFLAINIIMLSGLNKHTYDSFTRVYIVVGVFMIVILGVFLWKVKEPAYVKERLDLEKKYQINISKEEANRQLTSAERKSLYFLLASVFLWFFGYNAVMTKIADYLPKVLNMEFFNIQIILAQVFVVLMILPIGILSTYLGRKTMIIIGIIVSTFSLGSVFYLSENTPWLIAIVVGIAGVGWAMININSYPMVIEIGRGSNIGQYTGYYYSASMLAQIFTPILSGVLMDAFGRQVLFPYGALFVLLSLFTMLLVHHGDALKIKSRNIGVRK